MAPIEGVIQIQGDITSPATANQVISYFSGHQADLVVCDGAPDVTGLHDLDEYVQSQLLLAALSIVTSVLMPGGSFVAKIFRGKDIKLLYSQMKIFFVDVFCAKPKSSRNSSVESFIVCRGFRLPSPAFQTSMLQELMGGVQTQYFEEVELKEGGEAEADIDAEDNGERSEESHQGSLGSRRGEQVAACYKRDEHVRQLIPFLACGDLSGWDSDRNYDLDPATYVPLEPVQPPTAPAYKAALEFKAKGLASI